MATFTGAEIYGGQSSDNFNAGTLNGGKPLVGSGSINLSTSNTILANKTMWLNDPTHLTLNPSYPSITILPKIP